MPEKKLLKANSTNQIKDYQFNALKKALEMEAAEIVDLIQDSELKGRGGAGFPTGLKWRFSLKEKADKKYLICNSDEAEVGTFKDRYLLENHPFKIIEGMVIAAYATNASDGIIYIRAAYAKPAKNFANALKKAREAGVLGEDILASGFSFDIRIIKGAGAYICGEETALLNSIEGKRGVSRTKPPYPIQEGLFGYPTLVNNVETFACVTEIINLGVDQYSKLGISDSPGTKLISLSGDINQPGVYEIEFGKVSFKEIIEDLGGGIKNGGELKFIIPGGASTAILPAEKIETKYTYDAVNSAGSAIGSGGVIVVAKGHDLFALMKNVSHFFMKETCGTCFPCREGNTQIKHLLDKFEARGKMTSKEQDLLSELSDTIYQSARCGLGQTSPNFICSIIDNYYTELVEGRG